MSLLLPESLRLLLPDGTVKGVLLEDYIRGVVAAALPADTPLEAMKALAVAARTFAANTHRHLDRDADVCTLRHCQAWSERANPRAARAALETRGVVATYNDELIEAFYFDHCDGKTRDAAGVLLNAPQYLKGVSCPCGSATMRGHGIGMCQRGMVAMARLGESSNYILRHYYSGVLLQTLQVDPESHVQEARTPVHRRNAYRTVLPTRHEPPLPGTANTPPTPDIPAAQTPPEPKPARKTTPVRRSGRAKPEQAAEPEITPQTRRGTKSPLEEAPTAEPLTPALSSEEVQLSEAPVTAPPIEAKPAQVLSSVALAEATKATAPAPTPSEPPAPIVYQTIDLLADTDTAEAEQAEDLLYFLAVEDVSPPAPVATPPPIAAEPPPAVVAPPPGVSAPPPQTTPFQYTPFQYTSPPPAAFAPPPAMPPESMPEDLPEPIPLVFEPPPFSMPEEMPRASELDFIAPPTGVPEQIPTMEGVDFGAPPHPFIEPNLDDFIPPIEKFYTPLDAPPSMPEGMPAFDSAHSDDTPFSWVPPPPMQENAYEVKKPQILMDSLPGPRIIAGNLPKAGMIVTIRDARGNSIITVSGVAKHYGAGGFEAPLTDDGVYGIKFDGTELDVKLNNETVFIYYQ